MTVFTPPLLTRRRVAMAALAAAGMARLPGAKPTRIVILGGGPAGSAAALSAAQTQPKADILLIERNPRRLAATAPAGPAVFAKPHATIGLETLRAAGVHVALDEVAQVDWRAGRLQMFSGRAEAFDRLILAPGTAPVTEDIPGLDPVARHLWPAAWGSTREARRLAAQLHSLPERGHLVLRLPANVSHPSIAQHRARDLDQWLNRHRPNARMTVLDGGDGALRLDELARVTWHTADVRAVDALRGVIETSAGALRADVVNFVPPMAAGQIAQTAGLTDASGWCPCDPHGRSDVNRETVILGDARRGATRSVQAARLSGKTARL